MRLHEFEAADIFESTGIPVPRRGVAASVHEAVHVAGEIGYPVMVKAQVLAGSRGLAGGIRSASTPEELKEVAEALLASEINGLPVRKILVAERADIVEELYVGVTVHGYTGKPVIVVSTEGGVHIEETARTSPEKVASIHIDPKVGFYPYQARSLLGKLGLDRRLLTAFTDVITQVYKVFLKFEAIIVEINPLAVLPNGGLLAVDGVLEIDNSALARLRSGSSDSSCFLACSRYPMVLYAQNGTCLPPGSRNSLQHFIRFFWLNVHGSMKSCSMIIIMCLDRSPRVTSGTLHT
jgi:succinyl-CoA synthetase beta subunit